VIQQLRPKLAQVPGITAFPNKPPPITIGARIRAAIFCSAIGSVRATPSFPRSPITTD
jgi:hypothetical protein